MVFALAPIATTTDIADILNFGLEYILPYTAQLPLGFGLIDASYIECKVDKEVYASAIVVWIIASAIVLIILLASVFDWWADNQQKKSKPEAAVMNGNGHKAENGHSALPARENIWLEIARTLSIFKNTSKIFHFPPENPDHFNCLHGIRVISISWIILGHVYAEFMGVSNNIRIGLEWFKDFMFLIVPSAYFAVDTFFVVSGFLLAVLFARQTRKSDVKITPIFMFKYYFHRLWRISPPFMIFTLITAFLTRNMGNGPFFPKDGVEVDMCRDTWYINIFYLQNFIRSEKICVTLAWYLANDMQFHWIAPIMLIPFAKRFRKTSFTLCAAFLVAHFLSVALIIDANKAKGYENGILNQQNPGDQGFFLDIYIKPYTRIGPFIIGLLLGFIVFEIKDKKKNMKLNWKINLLAWLVAIGLSLLMIFGLHADFSDYTERLSYASRVLYQTFSRTIWACCMAFLIFVCVTSNANLINKILSHHYWMPLSRLSFAVYLIHMTVNKFFVYRLEHPVYLQHDSTLYAFVSTWTISYILAYFFSLFFELPFIGLEKFIFPRH